MDATTTTRTLSAPLDGAATGLLELPNGAAHLEVSGGLGADGLYRAEVRHPAPTAEVHEGRVSLRYRRFSRMTKGTPDRVELGTEIPWEVTSGPLSHSALDLTAVQLVSVTTGAVSRLSLDLPRIQGTVPITIAGSANSLTVHRPAGTAIRVRIKGGSTRVALDADMFGSIGGPTTWNSQGHAESNGVYELTIEGNVSTLRVTTH